MKSLHEYIQESILDDEDDIMNDVETAAWNKTFIDNILNSKSFEEYDENVEAFKDILDDVAKVKYKPGQKARFKKGGKYVLINIVEPKKDKDVSRVPHHYAPHHSLYIGTSKSSINYTIYALDGTPQSAIYKESRSHDVKLQYSSEERTCYVYQIDKTKFETLIDYLGSLPRNIENPI